MITCTRTHVLTHVSAYSFMHTYMYIFETIFATILQQTYLDRIKWSDRINHNIKSIKMKGQIIFDSGASACAKRCGVTFRCLDVNGKVGVSECD